MEEYRERYVKHRGYILVKGCVCFCFHWSGSHAGSWRIGVVGRLISN